MNPQTCTPQEAARLSSERRAALDELGNLFFSNQPQGPAAAPAAASESQSKLDNLLAAQVPEAQSDEPPVEVLAVLAGGLTSERRLLLARAAARRLAVPHCSAAVVVFEGACAAIQSIGDACAETAERDPGLALRRLIADRRKLILIVAERACSFLGAGRRLPEHCVVLVTPDAESILEAYRELKTAAAATTGPVPEVFVFDATSDIEAEHTYRRLARVAIAHLGCTPTFAGRHLETLAAGHPLCRVPHTIIEKADADRVYEAISRYVAATMTAEALPPAAQAQFTVGLEEPKSAGGLRPTVPPVAGVLNVEAAQPTVRPSRGVFTAWEAHSSVELLAAVVTSLQGLLPGARGLAAQLREAVDAPERPDLLASDAAGRPVAVLLAPEGSAEALQRAIAARRWAAQHARLLALAFPQSGLEAASSAARCIVLVPEACLNGLAALCPREIELAGYTCVSHAGARGLMFRTVGRAVAQDEAVGEPPAEMAKAAACKTPMASAVAPRSVLSVKETDSAGSPPPGQATEQLVESGTSPDDDLSADEINDLRGHFEIDELT